MLHAGWTLMNIAIIMNKRRVLNKSHHGYHVIFLLISLIVLNITLQNMHLLHHSKNWNKKKWNFFWFLFTFGSFSLFKKNIHFGKGQKYQFVSKHSFLQLFYVQFHCSLCEANTVGGNAQSSSAWSLWITQYFLLFSVKYNF